MRSDHKRTHPRVVVRTASPNYSTRTSPIELIVLHATVSHNRPGPSDLAAIGDFFAGRASQVSSHVCTDGDGHSARYVADENKAWHCAAYNSAALGIEQIFAAGDVWKPDEYRETARWIARWSVMHGIPIRLGAVNNGRVTRSGVLRHSDLGALGGGHVDPGTQYDLGHALALARRYHAALRAGRRYI